MAKKTGDLLRRSSSESKADVEQAINEILDCISNNLSDKPEKAASMYQLILGNLKTSNERLWFNTSLRLGKIYLDAKNLD